MNISSIESQIAALNSEIAVLENKVTRLTNAKKECETLHTDMSEHKRTVKSHKDSVNALFGSFSWEGETVKDFKTLYSNAVDYLNDSVLPKYKSIINDIDGEITRLRISIQSKRSRVATLKSELSR